MPHRAVISASANRTAGPPIASLARNSSCRLIHSGFTVQSAMTLWNQRRDRNTGQLCIHTKRFNHLSVKNPAHPTAGITISTTTAPLGIFAAATSAALTLNRVPLTLVPALKRTFSTTLHSNAQVAYGLHRWRLHRPPADLSWVDHLAIQYRRYRSPPRRLHIILHPRRHLQPVAHKPAGTKVRRRNETRGLSHSSVGHQRRR